MSNADFPGPSWRKSEYEREPTRRRGSRAARRGGDGGRGSYDPRYNYGNSHGGNGYNGNGHGANGYGSNGYGGDGYGLTGSGAQAGVGSDGDIGRGLGYRGSRGRRGRRGTHGMSAAAGRRGRGEGAAYTSPGAPYAPGEPGAPYGGPGQQDWTSGLYRAPDVESTRGLRQRVGTRLGTAVRSPRGYVPQRGPQRRPPGNLGQRVWRGSWWRRWTWKKLGLLSGALAAFTVLVLVAGFFYAYAKVPLPLDALAKPPPQSSMVYFANGKPVGCFCTYNRQVLSQAKLAQDPYLEEAFLAAEDRNFWHEHGISLTGTARAILVDLSGGGSQGGSTITEQFIKSYLVPSGAALTFKEKLKEIIMAIKLAKAEDRAWILQHYLNVINLGAGSYGVEAAAQTYFGVNAWQVTPAQAAMLAALVQAPNGFDPSHPASNGVGLPYSLLDRWIYVLGNMARDNPGITQQQFSALVPYPNPGTPQMVKADLTHFPKVTVKSQSSGWVGYRGYIMGLVQNELAAYYHISQGQINTAGLQIHTSIRPGLMNALYRAVRQNEASMGGLPWFIHIGAVLERPGTGQILAFYGGPGLGVKHCKKLGCWNNTILSPFPVGSSFKPYVLTTAVSENMNVKTSILNGHAPICIPPAEKGVQYQLQRSKIEGPQKCPTPLGYWPFTESGENLGNLSVPAATALSNDPAFEDLIHRTGVYSVLDMAAKLGVSPGTVQGLEKLFGPHGQFAGAVNSALGEGSLTPVDQANTFATLVSNGTTAVPHLINYVTENGNRVTPAVPAAYTVRHLLAQNVAADADYALSFDTTMPGATGHNAYIPRPMIAKTGTLGQGNQSSEAWFIGAIPQYALSVGMYTNLQKQNLDGLPSVGGWAGSFGGAWPATIWRTFMSQQVSNLPVKPLPTPNFGAPFIKWVQAPPVKKCPANGPGGQGGGGQGGPGHGHGHHHVLAMALLAKPKPGKKQNCTGGGPNPSPSPSPTGPSPSPSPSRSFSPSPSPSFTMPGHAQTSPATPSKGPAPQPKSAIPGTAAAILPEPALPRVPLAARVTGLV